MKNKTNQPNAVVLEWIIAIIGVFFIIMAYAFFMPLGNILIGVFVENGTPQSQLLFARNMSIWSFVFVGLTCLLWAFFSSYRKTYDTSQTGWVR